MCNNSQTTPMWKESSQEIPSPDCELLCVCARTHAEVCFRPVVARLRACQQVKTLPTRGWGWGGGPAGGKSRDKTTEAASSLWKCVCESHNATDLFLLRKRKWMCVCNSSGLSTHRGRYLCARAWVCVCSLSVTIRLPRPAQTDGSAWCTSRQQNEAEQLASTGNCAQLSQNRKQTRGGWRDCWANECLNQCGCYLKSKRFETSQPTYLKTCHRHSHTAYI